MKKYIVFTIMLFLTSITNAYAACTQEEKNNFKKYEDEYTVKYEINKTTKKYDLYFKAPKPDKYFYEIYADIDLNCSKHSDETLKCIGFPSGEYEVLVVGITNTCNDILKTINIKLPKYNTLSEDPLCHGIEEFVLCNPGYEKEISYEDFVSRVNTYKKNHYSEQQQEEKPNASEPKQENEMIEPIFDYLKTNWIKIAIVVAFIILVIITIIVTMKSIRKSRYLE